jgi:FAD/FMN-containing dehydrogenase/Fe-S oxidoreductase
MRTALRLAGSLPSGPRTRDLAEDLARSIEGEVRFGDGDRALYSTDASNYRRIPVGAVIPRSVDDVVQTVALCREHGFPVLSRGAGTSLAGQTCNDAVVIDWSKYLDRVLEIDRERRTARVQPGVVLDELRRAAGEGSPSLTFGPDPATHRHCTLGGMLGNDSCGVHSLYAEFEGNGARTAHNVRELEVLTYDGVRMRVGPTTEAELDRIVAAGGRRGEIYARLRELRDHLAPAIRDGYPDLLRRVSGYNLDELLPERGFDVARALVGTEGTCVTVLEAVVELLPSPRRRSLVILGFDDVFTAADQVVPIRERRPMGLEGFDARLVDDNRRKGINSRAIERLPDGHGWLLVEFGADTVREADALGRDLVRAMRGTPGFTGGTIVGDPAVEESVWGLRESGLGATAFVPNRRDHWDGWEDAAVPPERVGEYLRAFDALLRRYGYDAALYGHFGQGCIHTRVDFDLVTPDGRSRFRDFLGDAAEVVVGMGGSLSGEHGDGQSRAELLPVMFAAELLDGFREFKSIWDPAARMNPARVVDADPILSNLRLDGYDPSRPVRTRFAFGEDGGFAHAAMRCVGIGTCRRTDTGTMCPSYMVTREERHTTRGRARLLFEMMTGRAVDWRSDDVHDALELCLSCKGCKAECPVNVDMATYKAEFLSHYYRGRVRPRAAYSMGLIFLWARLGAPAANLVNAIASSRALAPLLKRAAGIAPERTIPRLATETFTRWSLHRRIRPGGERIVLWPDTFTNFFQPEIAHSAVDVLETAGFEVDVPDAALCCGRPLYDFGMLDVAERLLKRTLRVLRPYLREGARIVGLEPSCAAVFRDELPNMLPDDPDARRLRDQTVLLSELLAGLGERWQPPRMIGKALVQGHCHQTAVFGMEAELEVLRRIGLDAELLDAGCCGMAGAFGFERGTKYEVSRLAGERVLLPRVRSADASTIIVADGFSCRTQIEQGTGRRALHVAQVIDLARRDNGAAMTGRRSVS